MMVEIDGRLLEEAKSLSKARSNREAIELALRELLTKFHRHNIASHEGKIELELSAEELRRWREE
jgi:Arc/MetJ family transcription regulator